MTLTFAMRHCSHLRAADNFLANGNKAKLASSKREPLLGCLRQPDAASVLTALQVKQEHRQHQQRRKDKSWPSIIWLEISSFIIGRFFRHAPSFGRPAARSSEFSRHIYECLCPSASPISFKIVGQIESTSRASGFAALAVVSRPPMYIHCAGPS